MYCEWDWLAMLANYTERKFGYRNWCAETVLRKTSASKRVKGHSQLEPRVLKTAPRFAAYTSYCWNSHGRPINNPLVGLPHLQQHIYVKISSTHGLIIVAIAIQHAGQTTCLSWPTTNAMSSFTLVYWILHRLYNILLLKKIRQKDGKHRSINMQTNRQKDREMDRGNDMNR